MVNYIVTPWRNRRELLQVRQAFYLPPDIDKATRDGQQHKAVSLVSVWVQRGNCPHSIESTALLVAAILNETLGNTSYAMRAAYSTAFSRFVTGLLDGYQDKRHKLSMYSIARNIGLPATFVELRHQCTHEELPSIPKLRAAAERSLQWIWDHYWKNLDTTAPADIDECRSFLQEYLQWRASNPSQYKNQGKELASRLQRWDTEQVLELLMEFTLSNNTDTMVLLQSIRLSRELMSNTENQAHLQSLDDKLLVEKKDRSLDSIRAQIAAAEEALQDCVDARLSTSQSTNHRQAKEMEIDNEDSDGDGWEMWKGPWIPKPIGIV